MLTSGQISPRSEFYLIPFHALLMYTPRLCRDRGMFSDTLDVIKFICKDIWATFWDKQVDNLRTNHRVCTSSLSELGGPNIHIRAFMFFRTINLSP